MCNTSWTFILLLLLYIFYNKIDRGTNYGEKGERYIITNLSEKVVMLD